MASVIDRYRWSSQRRYRQAAGEHKRLDVQGLRMVAVLTVFTSHLWGWPRGGFVGVDVFFVISGFLITGNLMRNAESTGTVSFWNFYKNRIRRIVPAATVVLLLTYAASVFVFRPFRAHSVGIDAVAAFAFFANWRFAIEGTDYFAAAVSTVSPLQHYWSLSIEEQFYFVWPALIFVISVVIIRKGWTHSRRMQLAGLVMSLVVAVSLTWAIHETTASPTWAYFNTFSRAWELGIGAILATAVGLFVRMPHALRPLISWLGLGLIVAALFLITDDAVGFPAPWAVLPVVGAALVIAAGAGQEPRYQGLLRNPVSTYIGDVSYSLYLVHWPVIVILGTLMDSGICFSISVVGLAFGIAVLSFHFIENPLRKATRTTLRTRLSETIHERSNTYAALGAGWLIALAGVAFVMKPAPDIPVPRSLPTAGARGADAVEASGPTAVKLGPLGTALREEITAALGAVDWPPLSPSWDSLFGDIGHALLSHEIAQCRLTAVAAPQCTYGSQSAPITVVIVGDSVGSSYAESFRELAVNSNGQLRVINETMEGCVFTQDPVNHEDTFVSECEGRKDSAVDIINTIRPDAVIISNIYRETDRTQGSSEKMTVVQWAESLSRILDRFRGNTNKVVLLSPPPSNAPIAQCVSKLDSTPASCIGTIPPIRKAQADAERQLADRIGAVWIDTIPWFCSPDEECPSFVGTTPARLDGEHMTPAYASKITPVVAETLRAAGVPLP
ncbi:acyltransferase family protein [Mycolicibacterium sp. P1-5]|uniref:acyltransferase family protein n=1 Tax=Mycolicibacterium sp. P1-5 TaxID=2024617 RepID=UPI0011EDE35C|nr:acyltransferase family protein [Mycolicibacterium sp. P1-5]KAA0110336.1 acyltransferase [Mycolicibacterium sp. P1-5]